MNVVEINNPHEWDTSVMRLQKYPSFLQSSAWAECLQEEGKRIRMVVVEEQGRRLAAALLVENQLPLGYRYWFCPGGPVVGSENQERVCSALADFAKTKKCIFFRFEPLNAIKNTRYTIIQTKNINPPTTNVLDLKKSFEQLVGGMHKKTRYSLRKASESKLEIKNEKNLDIFLELLKATGERDKFRLHHSDHYAAILASPNALQLTAYHEGVPVASALWFGFAATLTYLFAAGNEIAYQVSASYALQEAAIHHAQKNNFERYDFFGIAPRTQKSVDYIFDPKHPYAGFTTFKIRFGGDIVEKPGTFDLVISPLKYRLYQLLRFARRLF